MDCPRPLQGAAGWLHDNFLHEPLVKPAQSLEGKLMVTSVSMVQGPMTARYVFGHEDQELGQVLYTYLAAFYSDPSHLLESGSTCSPARHVQGCGCGTNKVYICLALMLAALAVNNLTFAQDTNCLICREPPRNIFLNC